MIFTGSRSIKPFDIRRVEHGADERVIDAVAVEEPLQIYLSYWSKGARASMSMAAVMRTPGHDRELAAGLLLSEGVVQTRDQIEDLRQIGTDPSNEVVADLKSGTDVETWRLARNTVVGASCGICGKRTREAIAPQLLRAEAIDNTFAIDCSFVESLPELLRSHQPGFEQTGGLHAAALVSSTGEVQALYEDIGRHNALDKLIGSRLLAGEIPISRGVLFLSSRSSFELIQKAAMAGAPILATVGGPSSLAIEAAREYGLTLIGFVRERRFNVYAGEWRIHS
ncbi:MAG: formate dehydrogenase accessory sulfurtransferase FdhD [Acidobacteriaceae bacterium]|nr:formate dehydrogenase accessory sulfurtransferase FdhD [Acidobacteriaceae bacterium]